MKRGFTIVELLIVVVVIAILAGVTVVAFGGIRDRAINSAIMSSVNATDKFLKLYNSSSGEPLQVNKQDLDALAINQGNAGAINSAGVCITTKWPTDSKMAQENSNSTSKPYYCDTYYTNTSWSLDTVTDLFISQLDRSDLKTSLQAMPNFPSVVVKAQNGSSGPFTDFTVRGVRYAYFSNASIQKSFIYYPIIGKTCPVGDTSVKMSESFWGEGYSYTQPTTLGGDYTSNNTQYCARIISYR